MTEFAHLLGLMEPWLREYGVGYFGIVLALVAAIAALSYARLVRARPGQ